MLARYISSAKHGSLELEQACYDEARQLEVTRVEKEVARLPLAKP